MRIQGIGVSVKRDRREGRPNRLILAGVTLVATSCAPVSQPDVADFALQVVQVAEGLNRPVDLIAAPGDTQRLFIVEQPGVIKVLDLTTGRVLSEPFLDIDSRVSEGYLGNGEQGLLSLAFHPDYFVSGNSNEGCFFVHYSSNSGATTIERYRVGSDPNIADPESNLLILRVSQPFANHNGGTIAFGPNDGYLYIGLGDGGAANDPGGRAQNDGELLGKILRIDVNAASPGQPYTIPPGNPFVGLEPRHEIWAKGLRNPWRFSFDGLTGDLYIADVGQEAREEINFIPVGSGGGENYGWRCMEGTACTFLSGCSCNGTELTPPCYEYFHNPGGGRSITGGYVYRGSAIPELQARYFFADFVSGRIWSLRIVNGQAREIVEHTDDLNGPEVGGVIGAIASFGQDAAGELYIVDRGDSDHTGRVFKITLE